MPISMAARLVLMRIVSMMRNRLSPVAYWTSCVSAAGKTFSSEMGDAEFEDASGCAEVSVDILVVFSL